MSDDGGGGEHEVGAARRVCAALWPVERTDEAPAITSATPTEEPT